jgi:uncharacterized membrane protein YkoI
MFEMKNAITIIAIPLLALLSIGCGTGERLEKLMAALDKAEISLGEAIDIASAEVPDGTVVEAELEVEDGEPYYEVEVLVGDLVKEVSIDPQSGEVLSIEDELEGGRVNAPCPGSISVAEAIVKAVEAAGGSAVEVELEGCEFEVQVVKGDEMLEAEVEPDGTVTEIEESDEDDEDDDNDLDDDEEDEKEEE